MNQSSTVLIAANPKSGAVSRAALVSQLAELLRRAGRPVEIVESLEQVAVRSAELGALGQLSAVVAAGGDGTVAAVANLTAADVPIAVYPLGTENLLARQMNLSADPQAAARTILGGQVCQVDAGLANGRLFLVMLGCGFDAEVVAQMHRVRRGHINRWSYVKPIWRAIRTYSYADIEVELLDAGQPLQGTSGRGQVTFSTAWLFAFNLPRYAANLRFCEQATGDDGLLDLCAFTRGGLIRGLFYLTCLWLGRHQRLRDVRQHRSAHFRLSSQARVPYQIDGDPGGQLPLEVKVLPGRLNLLVPE